MSQPWRDSFRRRRMILRPTRAEACERLARTPAERRLVAPLKRQLEHVQRAMGAVVT